MVCYSVEASMVLTLGLENEELKVECKPSAWVNSSGVIVIVEISGQGYRRSEL